MATFHHDIHDKEPTQIRGQKIRLALGHLIPRNPFEQQTGALL